MAYCDFCHKGIGSVPYDFLYHEKGLFGGHPECILDLKIRLDMMCLNEKNSQKENGRNY